jgi:hypothetical protein
VPVYADEEDYESSPYGATPAPADIVNRLTVASADVDELLLTAVYEVDGSDMPTDADVAEALKQAAIAQAKFTIDRDDADGTGQVATEVAIGSARIKYGSSSGSGDGTEAGRFSPRARTILHLAGLIPNTVYRPGG